MTHRVKIDEPQTRVRKLSSGVDTQSKGCVGSSSKIFFFLGGGGGGGGGLVAVG